VDVGRTVVVGDGAGDDGAGAVVVGLAVVGAVVGVPPAAHETPLIVQLVGAPLPATMKPNVVVAPAGMVALYPRSLAVTVVPDVVIAASQKLPSFALEGSRNASVQPVTAVPPVFLMV
jgi:hypothetical protein